MVERPTRRPTAAEHRDQIITSRFEAMIVFTAIIFLLALWSWWTSPNHNLARSPYQTYVVDLNAATAEELNLLPGVGPKLARDILEYREQKGRFASIDDLRNIRGIKEGRLRALAPYLKIASVPPSPALPANDPIDTGD